MRNNFYRNLRFSQDKTTTSKAVWKYMEVAVKWEDRKAMDILHKKVEEMSYPLGDNDCYIDESKGILKSILNDDVLTDCHREEDDM